MSERMPRARSEPFRTLSEVRSVAKPRVSERVWSYIEGGSGDERTLRGNEAAFRRWALRPRALTDVSTIELRSKILGQPVGAPFFICPMAYLGEVHADAERGVARAAAEGGVLAIFSTLSSDSLERIAGASPTGPRWFQLYLQPDFSSSRALIERAERASYSGLVITVDVPVLAVRDTQARAGFAIDATVPIGNGPGVLPPPRGPVLKSGRYHLRAEAATTWDRIGQIRSITKLPVVVKGVLTADDAERALGQGAAGVIVSNHGGRQLDGSAPSLEALPEIVAGVGERTEVYLDGGIRRAADVLIALALGARAVGVGRPILWALAAGGGPGVRRYLDLLSTELATSMALCGRRSLGEIDATTVSARLPTEGLAPDRASSRSPT